MSHPQPLNKLPMARSILLFGLVTSIIVLVWCFLGRPVPVAVPAGGGGQWLNCLSYAPFHGEQAPYTPALRIPDEQIADDLRQLAKVTPCIRTYSAAGVQGKITRMADALGLKVYQGIWIGRNLAENRREIEAALRLARYHPKAVQALIVGNEVLLRGELGPDKLKQYLTEVRRRSGLPVTYADVWEFWLKAPDLATSADFITIHILPYWEDIPIPASEAVQHVREVRERVVEAFPGKEILIGEVGWPSGGRMRAGALPSRANQALVLQGVVEAARGEGWKINLIEAFDQPWKSLLEGTVGGTWGVFDDALTRKFGWGEPVSNYPRWKLQAGLGIGAAFIVFAAAWLFVGGREPSWRQSLAVAAIALASGLVFGWAATGLPMEPPEPGDRLRSALMLVSSLLVPVLAGVAVVREASLPGAETVLNAPLRARAGLLAVLLSLLFAATLVAAIHIGLGLVFDPRYKDFQLALLSGPIAAFTILALLHPPLRGGAGMAEKVICGMLGACALFVVANEGIANWQALWFGALTTLLGATALRTSPAPG